MTPKSFLLFLLVPALVRADPALTEIESKIPANPLKEAYFGETHVHTSYSLDA